MGDRVSIQCFDGPDFGAVLYCHWSGSETPEIIAALAKRMATRRGDITYATARLAQIAIGTDDDNTGFGIYNAEHLLTEKDSPGDAGVVLVDVNTFEVKCFGGYLQAKDGKFVDIDAGREED